MSVKKIDLTGKKFGRLIVLNLDEDYEILRKQKNNNKPSNSKDYERKWICQCECGNIKSIRQHDLMTHRTSSCGCLQKEQTKKAIKKYNTYDLTHEYGIGYVNKEKGNIEEFYFDLEDYDKIKKYNWCESSNGYLISNDDSTVLLHQLITDFKYPIVDHKNRNKKDNQKQNLRPATFSQNIANSKIRKNNTSGITGVFLLKQFSKPKWRATIVDSNYKEHGLKNRIIRLGDFYNFEDAVKARLKAEQEYYGEFAPQRNLFEKYKIFFPEIV